MRVKLTNDLTNKDMTALREANSVHKQHKKSQGVLRDYSLQHRISMEWDLNEEAIKEKIFRLKIDDVEVLIDWEEMMRLGRWV